MSGLAIFVLASLSSFSRTTAWVNIVPPHRLATTSVIKLTDGTHDQLKIIKTNTFPTKICQPKKMFVFTAEYLCRFVSKKSAFFRSNNIGVLVYSLRAYLKFLQLNWYVTPSLAATIPRPPNWSGASLPQALNKFWSVFLRRN